MTPIILVSPNSAFKKLGDFHVSQILTNASPRITGVPNAQLVKEKAPIAEFYKGKSVAEQNSVDLAWNLLMEENYVELRACIYSTPDEMLHFRQLIVNAVMATGKSSNHNIRNIFLAFVVLNSSSPVVMLLQILSTRI